MPAQEARRHHFVPKFLLKPWVIERPAGQFNLPGYFWNEYRGQLGCKRRGLDSFCNQIDLLTLGKHHLGRDALERVFFGNIDTKGSAARELLLASGPQKLTGDQRSYFARLLLALESGRPKMVEKLRNEAPDFVTSQIDSDPDIRAALKSAGFEGSPADYIEKIIGLSIGDGALTIIEGLTDLPDVGGRLI